MQNINIKDGGNLLASGGFGCIFSPALRCNNSTKRQKNGISKLMITKYAKEEYNILLKLKKNLKVIPNYKNYFLVSDFSICEPNKLTKIDLRNFNRCSALKKNNITKKNINKSLENVLALNMPYGGITIDSFIGKNRNYDKLVIMNNKLIELLLNGILPMNAINIYHNDIKDSNILIDYQKKSVNTRLIDWSLTVQYVPFKNNIFPKNWRNRPLQFNIPFSVILFTDMFYESYTNFLKENDTTNNKKLINFIKNYIMNWSKERGLGHYKYINKIMYMLFEKDIDQKLTEDEKKRYIQNHFTNKYIINYLLEILQNYTSFKKDGSLNMREYLDNIFIKNVDIWGFTITYFPLYELFYKNYKNLNEKQFIILKKLKDIFIEYLFKSSIKIIDTNSLVNDLKSINEIINIKNSVHNTTFSKKLNKFSKKNNSSTRKNF